VLYLNDGDWVESCTALVEHMDGRLELIDWVALNKLSMLAKPAAKMKMGQSAAIQSVTAEIALQHSLDPALAAPAGV
jgi:hypothetical protein